MSITTPAGFSAAATTAGIKASGKKDMALVVSITARITQLRAYLPVTAWLPPR